MGARRNWTEEQIIGILKQVKASRSVAKVCREYTVGKAPRPNGSGVTSHRNAVNGKVVELKQL